MRIAIEGAIGSGKTSTAILVAQRLGYSAVLEQTETHPFLADFYSDIEKYKLETELGFVLLHYHQLHPLESAANVVCDFSQGKDLIFARMNLQSDDFELFSHMYSKLYARVDAPKVTIVLDVPVTILIERIMRRARSYEMAMKPEYLERLIEFYDEHREDLGPDVRVIKLSGIETRNEVASAVISALNHAL